MDNSEEVPHLKFHSKLVSSKHHSHEPLSSASGIYKTVVYSRTIKDACCRPTEEKVLCFQWSRHHYEHNKDSLVAIFATKSGELYHAFVAHGKHPDPNMMRDILIKSTINMSNNIHVEMVHSPLAGWGLFSAERRVSSRSPQAQYLAQRVCHQKRGLYQGTGD